VVQEQIDSAVERRWRERIDRWRSSGLSIREFCVRNRLTESTFYLWKRELQARDVVPSAQPKFVPLTVIPSATVSVEVRCPSGHVVCVPACEVSALVSVFAALGLQAREAQPC